MSGVRGKEAHEIDELVTIFAKRNDYFVYHCIDDGYARLIRQSQRSISLAKREKIDKMLGGGGPGSAG
jgi:hypothetical protein